MGLLALWAGILLASSAILGLWYSDLRLLKHFEKLDRHSTGHDPPKEP